MSKAELAKSPSERGRKAPTSIKKCQFQGCDEKFEGIGAAKYCQEHRKPMYRKYITMHKREQENKDIREVDKPEKSNAIIHHNHTQATEEVRTCPCGKQFKVTLFPNIDVYPKFCPEHTNPYKRERLLQSLGLSE